MATSHGEYLKSRGDTPTKPVKGRKAKEESVDDFSRLCGVNFKVKFGNFHKSTRYISMENLLNLLAARRKIMRRIIYYD